ncbi:hypothetical protein GJ496_009681 [Pomphorhynchus laevis]|nr:hypothetical protein GJ496_009681 [Pomphorhynchus laevis]
MFKEKGEDIQQLVKSIMKAILDQSKCSKIKRLSSLYYRDSKDGQAFAQSITRDSRSRYLQCSSQSTLVRFLLLAIQIEMFENMSVIRNFQALTGIKMTYRSII